MNVCTIDRRTAELLAQASDWRLVGLLLERPRGTWWEQVASLVAGTADQDLQRAGALAEQASETHYLALLGPGGPLSPRESGHRRTADPARTLAEIRRFHQAFAFEPEREDPVDHVAVASAFVGWLRLKEAYAVANADSEAAEITRVAAERFQREHLAPCAQSLASALAELEGGYLEAAARALLARVGPRPADVEGDWVPEGLGLDDPALSCGLGGDSAEELPGGTDLPPEFTAGLRSSE